MNPRRPVAAIACGALATAACVASADVARDGATVRVAAASSRVRTLQPGAHVATLLRRAPSERWTVTQRTKPVTIRATVVMSFRQLGPPTGDYLGGYGEITIIPFVGMVSIPLGVTHSTAEVTPRPPRPTRPLMDELVQRPMQALGQHSGESVVEPHGGMVRLGAEGNSPRSAERLPEPSEH
jgi:hypothetical protein